LRRVRGVALVLKRHRFKRQDGFAGFVHRFDFLFESARGAERAELAVGVYDDIYSVGEARCHTTNGGDKGSRLKFVADADRARLASDTKVADIDIVTARGEIGTGELSKGDVEVAGVAFERIITDGRVIAAGRKGNNGILCLKDYAI
jgi:hypothetical protein